MSAAEPPSGSPASLGSSSTPTLGVSQAPISGGGVRVRQHARVGGTVGSLAAAGCEPHYFVDYLTKVFLPRQGRPCEPWRHDSGADLAAIHSRRGDPSDTCSHGHPGTTAAEGEAHAQARVSWEGLDAEGFVRAGEVPGEPNAQTAECARDVSPGTGPADAGRVLRLPRALRRRETARRRT